MRDEIKKKTIEYLFMAIILVGVIFFLSQSSNSLTGYAVENPFNLEIEIPGDYQRVSPGDNLWFTTKILNFANEKRVDVTLEYTIIDEDQETLLTRTETVAIETQASFVGKMEIPDDTPIGDYMLKVEMIQASGESSIGKASFKIKTEENFNTFVKENKFAILIVLGILFLILLIFWILPAIKKIKGKRNIKRKIKRLIKIKYLYN